METCICSLPTSTKAASGSRTARLILLVVIRALTFLAASQARWRFWKRQIFPTGKPTRASPKCADIRHQSQSTLRAQGTKAHTATLLTTSHDAHPTKFMAREQVQMEHETTLGKRFDSSTPTGLHHRCRVLMQPLRGKMFWA